MLLRDVVLQMPMIGFAYASPPWRGRLRNLQGQCVHVEAGQGVVADLGEVRAVQQVEHAKVEEERVVGLTGPRLAGRGAELLVAASNAPLL